MLSFTCYLLTPTLTEHRIGCCSYSAVHASLSSPCTQETRLLARMRQTLKSNTSHTRGRDANYVYISEAMLLHAKTYI